MIPFLRNSSCRFIAIGWLSAALLCVSEIPPQSVKPLVIATLPHDSAAFTQGLFFDSGRLYQSDGLYGESAIRVIDAGNGAILRRIGLPSGVFAEGCALLDNDVIQLTWREQTAFIYRLPDLVRVGTLTYAGEGWGITTDGASYYMSNGSDTIVVRKRDFTIVRKIPVHAGGAAVTKLNELEWAKGLLYANIWYSDRIAEIDPKNGRVLRFIDCADLVKREAPVSSDHVLNGIAYDPGSNVFYLTGKKWKNVYVVKVEQYTPGGS